MRRLRPLPARERPRRGRATRGRARTGVPSSPERTRAGGKGGAHTSGGVDQRHSASSTPPAKPPPLVDREYIEAACPPVSPLPHRVARGGPLPSSPPTGVLPSASPSPRRHRGGGTTRHAAASGADHRDALSSWPSPPIIVATVGPLPPARRCRRGPHRGTGGCGSPRWGWRRRPATPFSMEAPAATAVVAAAWLALRLGRGRRQG